MLKSGLAIGIIGACAICIPISILVYTVNLEIEKLAKKPPTTQEIKNEPTSNNDH